MFCLTKLNLLLQHAKGGPLFSVHGTIFQVKRTSLSFVRSKVRVISDSQDLSYLSQNQVCLNKNGIPNLQERNVVLQTAKGLFSNMRQGGLRI